MAIRFEAMPKDPNRYYCRPGLTHDQYIKVGRYSEVITLPQHGSARLQQRGAFQHLHQIAGNDRLHRFVPITCEEYTDVISLLADCMKVT